MTYSTNNSDINLGKIPEPVTDYITWLYSEPYSDIPTKILFGKTENKQKKEN